MKIERHRVCIFWAFFNAICIFSNSCKFSKEFSHNNHINKIHKIILKLFGCFVHEAHMTFSYSYFVQWYLDFIDNHELSSITFWNIGWTWVFKLYVVGPAYIFLLTFDSFLWDKLLQYNSKPFWQHTFTIIFKLYVNFHNIKVIARFPSQMK